jgi:hypothetical protein
MIGSASEDSPQTDETFNDGKSIINLILRSIA